VKRFSKLNTTINLALVFMVLVFCGILVKRFVINRSNAVDIDKFNELKVGDSIELPDIIWEKAPATVVFGLNTKCKFCTESAPFYKELVEKQMTEGSFQLVAVFPESLNESRQYLEELKVPITEIRQSSLRRLGFKGTPSVVVVDRFGSVKSISLGKLTAEDESQMIASLDNVTGKTSISTDKRAVSLKEVETLRIKNKVVVLDIREREAYSREHLAGTVNIPIDELEARAVNELPPDSVVVIHCNCNDSQLKDLARTTLRSQGFEKLFVLIE
jgi:rhodanese-related sulfurtransferase